MSLSFSNLTSLIDLEVGTNSTTYSLADKTLDINLAIDNLLLKLFGRGAGGPFQLDDSNYTDYPILTTNLVSGQRDYSFTTDGGGELILDIYKVMAKDSSGVYHDLTPVDMKGPDAPTTMNDGNNTGGTPTTFGRVGNGIFLDVVPNYNSTNGLKIFVSREASYFVSTDTSKKWGFTGLYHDYLVLFPSYRYARRNTLANVERLKRDLVELEQDIAKHIGKNQRYNPPIIKPAWQNNR